MPFPHDYDDERQTDEIQDDFVARGNNEYDSGHSVGSVGLANTFTFLLDNNNVV